MVCDAGPDRLRRKRAAPMSREDIFRSAEGLLCVLLSGEEAYPGRMGDPGEYIVSGICISGYRTG